MIIGKSGLIHLAGLLHHLHQTCKLAELEITDHAFLPKRWCIGVKGGRWIQVFLDLDDYALKIDYIRPGHGSAIVGVYDVEDMTVRVLAWLRGETEEI